MANKNFNNQQNNKNSLKDRAAQIRANVQSADKLKIAVKNSQVADNAVYGLNRNQPQADEKTLEKLAVDRSVTMMKIYRNSLLVNQPEHNTDFLVRRANGLIETFKNYKTDHNKEDIISGPFKSLVLKLGEQIQRPNPDNAEMKNLLNEINRSVRGEIKTELEKNEFTTETNEYVAVPDDYYRIARLDFESTLEPIKDSELSPEYVKARNSLPAETFSPDAYKDLHKRSETWARCSEFPNFRNLQPKFFEALTEFNIPPQVADTMKIKDIEDLMLMHAQKHDSHPKGNGYTRYSLFGQDDAKRQFVKFVVETDEKAHAFKQMMVEQGARPEYAAALVEKMRRYGVMNPGTVRDEAGEIVPPPKFKLSIHHKHAIQDMGNLDPKSKINDLNNFVLILDKPYHQPICHGLDLPSYRSNAEGKCYTERIKFPKGLVVMFGFNKKKQMRLKENENLPKRAYSWMRNAVNNTKNNFNDYRNSKRVK